MEMLLLDADYMIINARPVLRLFGKSREGKTVCAFYENYLPYFYALNCDAKEITALPDVKECAVVRRKVIGAGEREMCKITLVTPAKTPELREQLRSKGADVFEADILFKYRFMADLNISGFDWLDVANGDHVATNSVRADVKLRAHDITRGKSEHADQLRYLAFDLECVADEGIPEARKDPIILISLVFSEPFKGRPSMVLGIRPGRGVDAFESEKEMLEEFINTINTYDPDILTGFNINNFDLPYILERMAKNGIKPVFGRCISKPVMVKKVGNRFKSAVPGRVFVDSYEIIKKDFSLQRYGLDFVAERLLKQKKDDVKKSEIAKLWKANDEGYARLVQYCLQDSVLALNLVLQLNLLEKYIALAKVSGTLLQDTIGSGETGRIENFLLREFNKEGFVLPSKGAKPDETGLIGGEVLEPLKGVHSSVAVLDFRSMYPSIIRSFNICPSTLTKDKENSIELPSGARFLRKEVQQGIVPRVLKELMEARQAVKAELKKTKDKQRVRQLNGKQWALKILANAFYGYFGYVNSRMFNLEIANAITSTGRKTILDTKKAVESIGYTVVYGDTDSVFVRIGGDDLNEIAAKAEAIVKHVGTTLPEGIELEFEKIFKRFLPLTKKRYVAWCFKRSADGWEESIESKGIETVRRDWCDLVGLTMSDIITILLKEADQKKAIDHFKKVTERLLRNEIPLQNLVITKTMTKPPKGYAGVQPHIELVKKIQARNPAEAPGIGDRIGYVIVKGTQLLSKRAEDPSYITEKGLQIDSSYYIENQLLPPLERIFAALGVSRNELLGNGKQMGLMDAISRKAETQVLEQAPLEQVTGLICQACSAYYAIPTLSGICRCGGQLLFSTTRGPARVAVVGKEPKPMAN
ncbi:MAG: ribonuclease H-like domain-containing protein [Candidatus Aenigmarchaeota archaeon]|nr:ribonuclease H-like domain-containing protein [Candidatus Aenigmarchaeota archaeon]